MKESITLIWFTGVISKYDISKYDIPNLKINNVSLLYILNTYKADRHIALITVYNDLEKDQYLKLIKDKGLDKKLMFIFLDYNSSVIDVVAKLAQIYNINYYIDYSRRRLRDVVPIIDINRLIHISQLLN